ncbi:hypothetical protein AYO44_03250 [Planctomycetaceae bacterium SCGC AG-212-F19]|nr:hypothetical protein AYO44_03250 [Planctomycetaceae bacterium SCGC AG-212-F19]
MRFLIAFISFALLLVAAPAADAPRKPHPLVPSLPLLPREEEDRLDDIVNRFIQFDLGQLPGAEGQKAQAEFQKLGPEAFFALVRGFNRALAIEGSCPAVIIARKLMTILRASNDPALLDFARENLGLGVARTPHGGVLKDLKMVALLRLRSVGKGGAAPASDPNEGKVVIRPRQPGDGKFGGMSTLELAQATKAAKGDKLKELLREMEKRTGETPISTLVAATGADVESEIRYLALELLVKNLGRQSETTIKEKLKDQRAEVRSAAAWVVADRRLPFGDELIQMLTDKDLDVGQAARQALNRLAGGDTDYGPNRGATEAERGDAIRQWQEWWAKQRKTGE